MRHDMQSVIIERPRAGGHGARRRRKKNFLKDYYQERETPVTQEGMRLWAEWNTKSQTDVLGPLRGFLQKNVGRPWDKVWSEICRQCRGFMGDHLKTHVRQLVEEKVTIDRDGTVRGSKGQPVYGGRFWHPFYVHPETGLLCESPPFPWKLQKRREPATGIVCLEGQEYFKHQGVWYRVQTEQWTEKDPDFMSRLISLREGIPLRKKYSVRDVFGTARGHYSSANSLGYALVKVYGSPVYCTWKQQANSKECKKLNQLSGIV
jgi:hypothetical protein